VKILHILKKEPDTTTQNIIDLHRKGNEVKTVELYTGTVSDEKLLEDVFAHDKVFCW